MAPDDYAEEAEVWPENWPTFNLFSLMQRQWETDMGNYTGLRYTVLFELMDRKGLSGDAWWETLDDIRAMESAALKAMRDGA